MALPCPVGMPRIGALQEEAINLFGAGLPKIQVLQSWSAPAS